MYISAKTLDDLMHKVLKKLVQVTTTNNARRGSTREIVGVLLRLRSPRYRLSLTETKGKPFSALGELLWYLKGSNRLDFIEYYISKYKEESLNGKTIYGAYGPRLFNQRGQNQIQNIIKLLRGNPSSRRAVIQLFDAQDLEKIDRKEIPCTCTLQFFIRKGKLHMATTMRSNDVYLGLPHDIFTFTMIQEILARDLEVNLGSYTHFIGSLHLYDKNFKDAKKYLSEGIQSTEFPMPAMPRGDPWPSVNALIKIESKIRTGKVVPFDHLNNYWADLARLLFIHTLCRKKRHSEVKKVKDSMYSKIYDVYIKKRLLYSRKKIKNEA